MGLRASRMTRPVAGVSQLALRLRKASADWSLSLRSRLLLVKMRCQPARLFFWLAGVPVVHRSVAPLLRVSSCSRCPAGQFQGQLALSTVTAWRHPYARLQNLAIMVPVSHGGRQAADHHRSPAQEVCAVVGCGSHRTLSDEQRA
jgi:hypothetical protein